MGELIGALHEVLEQARQALGGQRRLRDQLGGPSRGETRGIGPLVVVGGMSIGDEQAGRPSGQELGHGRGAGAGDDQVRLAPSGAGTSAKKVGELGLPAPARRRHGAPARGPQAGIAGR